MNIVQSLGITSFRENNDGVNIDNIDIIIAKFEGHSSIAIKSYRKEPNNTSTSQNVSTDKFASIIKKLNTKKASKSVDISNKVIKESETFCAEFYQKKLQQLP